MTTAATSKDMALTVVRRDVTTREVLLDWGIAEAESILRWARGNGGSIPVAEKVVAGLPLTAAEEGEVARMIGGWWRAPMIGYFVEHPTTWQEATLEAPDLAELRLSSWFSQDPKFCGARTISQLLASPGGAEYRIKDYDPALERGHLVLVGTAPDLAMLRMAEGTHRSVERTARYRAGLRDGPAKVFVGVCPVAKGWLPYDGNKPRSGARAGAWWVD